MKYSEPLGKYMAADIFSTLYVHCFCYSTFESARSTSYVNHYYVQNSTMIDPLYVAKIYTPRMKQPDLSSK